jgi:hypothetical protein
MWSPLVEKYYRSKERSDAPAENSIDRPCCEQLVPKSLGYEDVKNSLQMWSQLFISPWLCFRVASADHGCLHERPRTDSSAPRRWLAQPLVEW